MNEEAQIKLKEILAKDVNELTPPDKEFMWARRDYIGKNSRAKFASVFDEMANPKPKEKPQEPEQTQQTVNPEENEKKTEGETTPEAASTEASPFENQVVDIEDDIVEPAEGASDSDEDDIVE